MGLTTLVNILFNFSEPIVLFIFHKYNGFQKKGVGISLERSEFGSGDRYEYPDILKRGVMFLNQEVVHLFPIGGVLKSGGGALK
jgi:hypothetical protein